MHAVFIQNPASVYDDAHGQWYHFPKTYLGIIRETVGDWVVFYESRKGAFGYTHVQRVVGVRPDDTAPTHFYADLDPESAFDFKQVVPRTRTDGSQYESKLAARAGDNTLAVRRISQADFAAIMNTGLREVPDIDAHRRNGPLHWMFDRGLIRVADDHSVLISNNKVDLPTVERLVNPEMRLMLDNVDLRHHPHPDYLCWHREQDHA